MAYTFRNRPTSETKQLSKDLKASLISVAGLISREITNQDGQQLGALHDLVFRWDTDEAYPPLTGLVVKVARRHVWIPAAYIDHVSADKIWLSNAKLDLREFKSRPGEVCLAQDVLDHQLIDVDGARVVRASDLYIAVLAGRTRLVGVDVGYRSLLRRLGPRQLRIRPTPDVVINWAAVKDFGGQDTAQKNLKLTAHRQELRRMRPGELADLLEDLGRSERQELLNTLTPEQAADALEEMEPRELETILRESEPAEGAKYLSKMEPDEAADALRDVDEVLRTDLLARMSKLSAAKISKVLSYDEATAGGFMNTALFTASATDTVATIVDRLRTQASELSALDALVIIDAPGKFVYDLALLDLLLAKPGQSLGSLTKSPASVTVAPGASISEVAELFVESRRASIVVIDEIGHPLGRIFADDIIDNLLPQQGRFRFPRLFS